MELDQRSTDIGQTTHMWSFGAAARKRAIKANEAGKGNVVRPFGSHCGGYYPYAHDAHANA
jgi:hypothetical protein